MIRFVSILALFGLVALGGAASMAHDDVRFQFKKERYLAEHWKDGTEWINVDAMAGSNGSTLMIIGGNKEMETRFLYRGTECKFEVWGERYGYPKGELLDTWEVDLGYGLKRLHKKNPQLVLNGERIRRIAHNIPGALMAWPPYKAEAHVPVRHVRFIMRDLPGWTQDSEGQL